MKIADMPAGPEMDRLVAEKVMGWTPHERNYAFFVIIGKERELMDSCPVPISEWRPSTDIACALKVIGRMGTMTLRLLPSGTYVASRISDKLLFHGIDETAPLAICRCALISVGCEVVP